MPNFLEKEFEWYLANQAELVKEYNGKFLVIKNCAVIGSYPNIVTAVDESTKSHKRGTFLVQKCSAGDQDYTATFRSRVA